MTDIEISSPDPLEQLVILRSHLEEWEEALRWAYGHFSALDLSENYRMGRPNFKPSKLTQKVGRAQARLVAYLEEEDNEPVQPD